MGLLTCNLQACDGPSSRHQGPRQIPKRKVPVIARDGVTDVQYRMLDLRRFTQELRIHRCHISTGI